MSLLNKQRIEKIEKLTWGMARAKGIPFDAVYDLIQDILADVHEKDIQGKLPTDNPDAYITTMVKSTIIDWLRVNKQTVSLDEMDIPDRYDPVEDVITKITLDQLQQYLNPTELEIYQGYRTGRTPEEIGRDLNLTTKNITVSMSRIIKKLQARVAEE